ncbi:MAG: hypothetical protein QG574_4462 [Cyanobacteriota bacterium erpe_2018_sw_21hr_WHONDRS-SW48-000092_B_bin.40]|jgi:hypothetical protein|nr:hypothetical protein [Cyanobacteriota bacterium erpe_2018_sw_21hr_WHONDRS-SW48-000092_B_bin.40]
MKKVLVLFAGLILSVPVAQAKESSIYSIFGEAGQNGVLKQLTAISKAAERETKRKSQSQGEKAAAECPSSVRSGQLTEQAEVSTEVRCQFAYALHRFVAGKARDYDSALVSSSNSAPGTKKPFAYLPYLEQEDFASSWWAKRSKSYRESGAGEKKQFLHRAIVDATRLYGWYGERVYGTAAYVVWEEAALRAVLKKQ